MKALIQNVPCHFVSFAFLVFIGLSSAFRKFSVFAERSTIFVQIVWKIWV